MVVNVWTTPNCVQCEMTKKQFDKLGVNYTAQDLSQNIDALEQFREQGLTQAPIVQAGEHEWSGFRLTKIKGVANEIFGEKRAS